jgi:hypothetical protein
MLRLRRLAHSQNSSPQDPRQFQNTLLAMSANSATQWQACSRLALFVTCALLVFATVSCTSSAKHPADPHICEVHGVKMSRMEAAVIYGAIPSTREYEAAQARFFPHGDTFIEAPGGKSSTGSKTGIIFLCSQCQKAKLAWLNGHVTRRPPSLQLEIPRTAP